MFKSMTHFVFIFVKCGRFLGLDLGVAHISLARTQSHGCKVGALLAARAAGTGFQEQGQQGERYEVLASCWQLAINCYT